MTKIAALIELPTPAALWASTSATANPTFTELIPTALYVVGIMVGIGVVMWIVGTFAGFFGRKD